MQPGDTIKPHDQPPKADEVDAPVPHKDQSPAPQSSPSTPEATPERQERPSDTAEADSPWQYSSETENQPQAETLHDIQPVQWTASEFIDHEKNSSWFIGLAALTGLAVAVIYLITKDIVTAAVIIIAAVLFGITAKRKPRTLQYALDKSGIHIGDKFYGYGDFKSFSVLSEGAFNSIQLMPLKRFMPIISLYYPLENEDDVLEVLGSYLPHQDPTHDPIDKLMRKVRF